MRNHKLRTLLIIMMSFALIIIMSACGAKGENVELSQDEMDSLMEQIAESDVDINYSDYMQDEAFANADFFGAEKKGEKGVAYAFLNEGEYVVLKDKAYNVSGSAGEAIIRYEYTENGVKLSEVEWSAEGEEHDSWLEKNFPEEYLAKARSYAGYDENGRSILDKQLAEVVEKAMGVPVESENLLAIDQDNGTYEVIKTIESGEGDEYKIETETVDKGKLSDLK